MHYQNYSVIICKTRQKLEPPQIHIQFRFFGVGIINRIYINPKLVVFCASMSEILALVYNDREEYHNFFLLTEFNYQIFMPAVGTGKFFGAGPFQFYQQYHNGNHDKGNQPLGFQLLIKVHPMCATPTITSHSPDSSKVLFISLASVSGLFSLNDKGS